MAIALTRPVGQNSNPAASYLAAKPVSVTAAGADKTAPPIPDRSITELVFTRHSSDSTLLLLPMLSHLSRIADRWITWLTSTPIDSQLLRDYDVDASKIRVIHLTDRDDPQRILRQSLNNGTSHTVIAFTETLSKEDISRFECAAAQGGSSGLLIRFR